MRYRKAGISLVIIAATVFITSFLLSYRFSPRGFFDFEQYIEDLKEMGNKLELRISAEEDAEGTENKGSTGEADSEVDEVVVYPNLKNYLGGNPYNTVLSDRDIVRNMRYLLGADGYSYLIKSIPNARKVKKDEEQGTFYLEGNAVDLSEDLAGTIHIKETGNMYAAYLYGDKILYYTNDKDFSDKIMKNSQIKNWVDSNLKNRELIYMNK